MDMFFKSEPAKGFKNRHSRSKLGSFECAEDVLFVFRVNNGGRDGTSCFQVKIRTYCIVTDGYDSRKISKVK